MLFLKILFGIGIIATLILACKLYVFGDYDYYENFGDNILTNVLYAISVILFLGILSGYWCYICFSNSEASMLEKVIVTIIPIVVMIVVYFLVFGEEILEIRGCIMYFVLFVSFTAVFFNYITGYNKNVEVLTETEVVDTTDLQLIAFNNYIIPNAYGDISGTAILGSGTVNGNISTSAEGVVSFWYEDENNDGTFEQADASNSKIKFIDDNEKAHVEVTSCISKKVKKDHNNNKEKVLSKKEYKEYKFYLPNSLKNYTLK